MSEIVGPTTSAILRCSVHCMISYI